MSKICPDTNLQNMGGTFCKFVFFDGHTYIRVKNRVKKT
jgi:hypothetical protein